MYAHIVPITSTRSAEVEVINMFVFVFKQLVKRSPTEPNRDKQSPTESYRVTQSHTESNRTIQEPFKLDFT